MDIQKYEAFIKTAELGSIKKASEALGYTQAGLSYIIKTLEEELIFPFSFAITAKSISLAAARSCSSGTRDLQRSKTPQDPSFGTEESAVGKYHHRSVYQHRRLLAALSHERISRKASRHPL